MRNIQDSLNKLGNREGFQKRWDEMRNLVLSNPEVRAFIREHEDELTNDMVEKSMNKLYEYATQTKTCDECPSLESCRNIIGGHVPRLFIQGKRIDVSYEPCRKKILHEEKSRMRRLIHASHVPKEIVNATFANLYIDEHVTEARIEAIEKAKNFVDNYKKGIRNKGLYLYGEFGVGKTYLLGAIANGLSEDGISSHIVYWPEFLRELKGSFAENTFNQKIDALKEVPVLMIDDIGAETMSAWSRDDVLGPILQYRMHENLPTFFTSNFNWKELEHHFSYTQRGEEERVKGKRIMERFRNLTMPVEMDGKSRRE